MKTAISKVDLASRFGDAFKIHEKSVVETLSTGIDEIDALTGGLPRGAITEIFGPASSGRTSLMFSLLAYATNRQETCALVDTNDVFSPTAATSAGIDFDRLLWIRCAGNLEHAFKATDLLLHAGGFGLVILDLGDVAGKDARRIISSWWYRFRRIVEKTPTALVVIAADSCVRSCALLSLEFSRESYAWSGPATTPSALQSPTHSRLLTGIKVQLSRHRPLHLGERTAHFNAQV